MDYYTLFVDETGIHDLENINKEYPILGLVGLIFNNNELDKVKEDLDTLKLSTGLGTNVVLHTADIVRSKNCFSFCKDPEKRSDFYKKIDNFLSRLDFTVIFAIIDREKYIRTYKNKNDVYILSLQFIEERFYHFLVEKHAVEGKIVIESRNKKLDKKIIEAHNEILTKGTEYIKPNDFDRVIKGLEIKKKEDNIPGLQVADLVATQLGRHYLWLRKYWGENLIEKIRKSDKGRVRGYGVKIFP